MKPHRKPSEQLFSYQVATQLPTFNQKYEYVHKVQTAQKLNAKKHHETQQKYRLGTIGNIKLPACLNQFYRYQTSSSASTVVHNI